MIDYSRPIRTVRSKRQLYVTGWHHQGRTLDTRYTGHNCTGFAYDYEGNPVDEACPWGAIENIPEESPFIEVVQVSTPEERRKQRELAAEIEKNQDNPLWGAF